VNYIDTDDLLAIATAERFARKLAEVRQRRAALAKLVKCFGNGVNNARWRLERLERLSGPPPKK
jgi:hypothetical protein